MCFPLPDLWFLSLLLGIVTIKLIIYITVNYIILWLHFGHTVQGLYSICCSFILRYIYIYICIYIYNTEQLSWLIQLCIIVKRSIYLLHCKTMYEWLMCSFALSIGPDFHSSYYYYNWLLILINYLISFLLFQIIFLWLETWKVLDARTRNPPGDVQRQENNAPKGALSLRGRRNTPLRGGGVKTPPLRRV